jgi:hypothetical protein
MRPLSAGEGGWGGGEAPPIHPAQKWLGSHPPTTAHASTPVAGAENQPKARGVNPTQLGGIEH